MADKKKKGDSADSKDSAKPSSGVPILGSVNTGKSSIFVGSVGVGAVERASSLDATLSELQTARTIKDLKRVAELQLEEMRRLQGVCDVAGENLRALSDRVAAEISGLRRTVESLEEVVRADGLSESVGRIEGRLDSAPDKSDLYQVQVAITNDLAGMRGKVGEIEGSMKILVRLVAGILLAAVAALLKYFFSP